MCHKRDACVLNGCIAQDQPRVQLDGVLETLRLQRLRHGIRTLKIHIRYSHCGGRRRLAPRLYRAESTARLL